MGHFIVSFRIKNDSTYQDRYDSFIQKAEELSDGVPWDETTSFFAFKAKSSSATADSICSDLYLCSHFDSSKDMMVVIDVYAQKKSTKGDVQYPNLLSKALGF